MELGKVIEQLKEKYGDSMSFTIYADFSGHITKEISGHGEVDVFAWNDYTELAYHLFPDA